MVDVAPRQMFRTGQVVEFIAEVAVATVLCYQGDDDWGATRLRRMAVARPTGGCCAAAVSLGVGEGGVLEDIRLSNLRLVDSGSGL